MSIRRTQQTVQHLWRSMEGQLPPPASQQQHARSAGRARASPPPDPEAGLNGHGFVDYGPPPELSAAAMQPPRLQQTGCCSRLLVASTCCICLFTTFVAWTLILQMQVVADARTNLSNRLSSHVPPPPRKPIPAILHRYGMVRRSRRGGRVDPETLRAAFPHWRSADGGLAIEAVVNDVALGLAAVVEQLDPGQELRIVNGLLLPPPPALLELPPANGESEEETEL